MSSGARPRLPKLGHVLAVAAGGALGGTLRHALTAATAAAGAPTRSVVLAENVAGAFLLGLVLTLLTARRRRPGFGPFLGAGVLGSFTTFSNLTLDVVALQLDGSTGVAVAYSIASPALGLAAAALGIRLGSARARSARRSA